MKECLKKSFNVKLRAFCSIDLIYLNRKVFKRVKRELFILKHLCRVLFSDININVLTSFDGVTDPSSFDDNRFFYRSSPHLLVRTPDRHIDLLLTYWSKFSSSNIIIFIINEKIYEL